ncbi:MAG: hypothetical protein B7X02_01180, partial [Rhodospirillales bacterium 12-54-5]
MRMIPSLGHRISALSVGALLAATPMASWAQTAGGTSFVCGSAAGQSTTQDCDTTYRDSKIACDDKFGTHAPCPKDPMPMKTTGDKPQSLIKDFTPYLFSYARDPKDASRPYAGPWARGTLGDTVQTFQLVGNAAKDEKTGGEAKRQYACVNQIEMEGLSAADQAKAVRLQLDNCTNQYILHAALGPEYRKNPTLLSGENPADPSERISLKSNCQPLRTLYDGSPPEYKVSDYLKIAWKKTLINPAATKAHAPVSLLPGGSLPPPLDTLASTVLEFLGSSFPTLNNVSEPRLPTGTTLKHTDDPAVKYPPTFPDITLAQLASPQEGSGSNYEMIVDPTHPFSPRWDYFYNDRELS